MAADAGELDFDNPRDANFDGVYEFSVTYTCWELLQYVKIF